MVCCDKVRRAAGMRINRKAGTSELSLSHDDRMLSQGYHARGERYDVLYVYMRACGVTGFSGEYREKKCGGR